MVNKDRNRGEKVTTYLLNLLSAQDFLNNTCYICCKYNIVFKKPSF